jgi:hypothetical protein
LLARIIRGIPFSGTISEFQSLCGINSHATCKKVLRFLNNNGIGRLHKAEFSFSAQDKLELGLLAVRQEGSPKILSQYLDWKDFEDFVSLILQQSGYSCTTNIHLKKPHMQIDVVANMGPKALIIDCKHWKNMGVNKMEECAALQHVRAKLYVKTHDNIDHAIPIIVTLNEPLRNFINKIPFVSISKFGSFLCNYDVYTSQLLHVLS